MTRTRVYLCWYSLKYIDFDHLSALAGIQPTRIEEKGTPVLHDGSPLYEIGKSGERSTLLRKENALIYELPSFRGYRVDNLLKKLMNTIHNPVELGDYCKSNGINVKLQIVVEGITDTYSIPVLTFSKDCVSFLAKLNACVDFDLYTSPLELKEI